MKRILALLLVLVMVCSAFPSVLAKEAAVPQESCDHQYTEWEITLPPTYSAPGRQVRYCLNCTLMTSRSIPQLVNPFEDVKWKDWFCDSVLWALDESITSGTSATTFSPGKSCSRAEVVTFLWRSAGSPEPETAELPFADVTDADFYCKPVLWAVENGVTSGTGEGTFSPFLPCNRAQVVTFLWRAAGEPAAEITEHPFTDVQEDAFYYDAMLWAVEQGVTTGTSDTAFSPLLSCNRAQVVTFLYRSSRLGIPRDSLWQEKTEADLSDLAPYDTTDPTAEQILALLDACDPDGAVVLRRQQALWGSRTITKWWTDSDELTDLLTTAVHEECHGYLNDVADLHNLSLGAGCAYYLGDGYYLPVEFTEVFPSCEIVAIVPEELQTFRFDTYVNVAASSNLASNKHGIYGLLNEYCAYLWGTNCGLSLYDYYCAQDDALAMSQFTTNLANGRLARAEFRYYILTYLLYARDNYPEIYEGILANEDLKTAFRAIDTRYGECLEGFTESTFTDADCEKLNAAMEAESYQEMLNALYS